jgi:divalent metal cation (Fe/Co/Zn/Cd) transporter
LSRYFPPWRSPGSSPAGTLSGGRRQQFARSASRFALAAYVTVDAILNLTGVQRTDHSPVGIGITVLSLIVMPVLAWFEIRTGRELASKSVMAGHP